MKMGLEDTLDVFRKALRLSISIKEKMEQLHELYMTSVHDDDKDPILEAHLKSGIGTFKDMIQELKAKL